MTKPDKLFGLVVVIATLLIAYLRYGLTKDIRYSVISGGLAVLWASCIFAGYYSIKSAIHLYREALESWQSYKPIVIGGSMPPPPSHWMGTITAGVLCVIFSVAIVSTASTARSPQGNPISRFPTNALDKLSDLDNFIGGKEEYDLTELFAFNEMRDLNIKLVRDKIVHFRNTGKRAFDLTPYGSNELQMLFSNEIGKLWAKGGAVIYDPDPGEVALILLPKRYSISKSTIIRFRDSGVLPAEIRSPIADFEVAVQTNADGLIQVLNNLLHKSPDYFLMYHDMNSEYLAAADKIYANRFVALKPKADAITSAIRQCLGLNQHDKETVTASRQTQASGSPAVVSQLDAGTGLPTKPPTADEIAKALEKRLASREPSTQTYAPAYGNLNERARLFAAEIVGEVNRNQMKNSVKDAKSYHNYIVYVDDRFRWQKHPQHALELRDEFAQFHIIDRDLDRVLETYKTVEQTRTVSKAEVGRPVFGPMDIESIATSLLRMAEQIEKTVAKQPKTDSAVGEKRSQR